MTTKNISRREALRQIIALPLAFYSGTRHVNAQTPNSNSTLPSLEYAEKVENATLNLTHESYIPPISHPSSFDYHEGGMGVLLRPLKSKNTYFASCAHAWDFDLAEHGGIELTLKAASRRGIVNPTREQIKERMKVAGYEANPSKHIFNGQLDFSVLDVTDIMSSLGRISTPISIDTSKQISYRLGDKVYWLPQTPGDSPFVEAKVFDLNVWTKDKKTGKPKRVNQIQTDVPISFESGKPVFKFDNGEPTLAGIITSRVINSNKEELHTACFTRANHIFNAIKKYEEGY